jgi:hypothetical protein
MQVRIPSIAHLLHSIVMTRIRQNRQILSFLGEYAGASMAFLIVHCFPATHVRLLICFLNLVDPGYSRFLCARQTVRSCRRPSLAFCCPCCSNCCDEKREKPASFLYFALWCVKSSFTHTLCGLAFPSFRPSMDDLIKSIHCVNTADCVNACDNDMLPCSDSEKLKKSGLYRNLHWFGEDEGLKGETQNLDASNRPKVPRLGKKGVGAAISSVPTLALEDIKNKEVQQERSRPTPSSAEKRRNSQLPTCEDSPKLPSQSSPSQGAVRMFSGLGGPLATPPRSKHSELLALESAQNEQRRAATSAHALLNPSGRSMIGAAGALSPSKKLSTGGAQVTQRSPRDISDWIDSCPPPYMQGPVPNSSLSPEENAATSVVTSSSQHQSNNMSSASPRGSSISQPGRYDSYDPSVDGLMSMFSGCSTQVERKDTREPASPQKRNPGPEPGIAPPNRRPRVLLPDTEPSRSMKPTMSPSPRYGTPQGTRPMPSKLTIPTASLTSKSPNTGQGSPRSPHEILFGASDRTSLKRRSPSPQSRIPPRHTPRESSPAGRKSIKWHVTTVIVTPPPSQHPPLSRSEKNVSESPRAPSASSASQTTANKHSSNVPVTRTPPNEASSGTSTPRIASASQSSGSGSSSFRPKREKDKFEDMLEATKTTEVLKARYMHTCIHTYIHRRSRSNENGKSLYIHTCIHAYIHACIDVNVNVGSKGKV